MNYTFLCDFSLLGCSHFIRATQFYFLCTEDIEVIVWVSWISDACSLLSTVYFVDFSRFVSVTSAESLLETHFVTSFNKIL